MGFWSGLILLLIAFKLLGIVVFSWWWIVGLACVPIPILLVVLLIWLIAK